MVSEEGISTDPEKISAIKEWLVPTSVTQLRSFVGICAYYRRFIGSFSEIAKPLHKLTEKGAKFIWDEKCQAAFTELKERSVVHFVKHFRHYLLGKKFLVRTDHGSLRWLMNFRNPDGQKF